MKLNSVGGTHSEKCKITFNVQYPTQNATFKLEQAGMIHLIFHIKHQVVFSCLTQCEGDRWRSVERVIPSCLSVICLDTGDARNFVSDHVTQIIGKKDWSLSLCPGCGGGRGSVTGDTGPGLTRLSDVCTDLSVILMFALLIQSHKVN